MEFRGHLRITGSALRNCAVAQAQDSLVVGALWLIGLYVLHVPLAPIWALIAAMFQVVLHFGPILGLLGPVFTAIIPWQDWEHPLGVLVLYPLIAVLDGLLLQPYIMRRTAKVPVGASILAPIVLGVLWPFWGVLLAATFTGGVVCLQFAPRKESIITLAARKRRSPCVWMSEIAMFHQVCPC
jgi:predicted PurR-regulated permease PerM